MSRRSKGSAGGGTKIKDKGPLPSHPSEIYKEHRSWLIRSLERNDVEIAALMELNRSIHKAKARILESCGELVLLDLGSGRLTVVNDELREEEQQKAGSDAIDEGPSGPPQQHQQQHHDLTAAQKEVCVDFLLRMRLRLKLSSRLIRRLNRLAHAMDGKDVTPPAPPRYGDLRFPVKVDAVEESVAKWKRQESAMQRIQAAFAERPSVVGAPTSSKLEGEVAVDAVMSSIGGESEKGAGPAAGDQEPRTERDAAIGDTAAAQPKSSNAPGDEVISKTDDNADDVGAQGMKEASSVASPTLVEDYAILKEYNSAYEKIWDRSTNRFKYVVAEQIVDPEYAKIKHGAGIGATTKIMSVQEREAEYKRWEANILARVPDQPTYEELGLKNRVFHLDARRKRCLEEAAAAAADQDDGLAAKKARGNDEQMKQVAVAPKHRSSGKELRKTTDGDDDDKTSTSSDNDEEKNDRKGVGSKKKKRANDDDDNSSNMFGDDDEDDIEEAGKHKEDSMEEDGSEDDDENERSKEKDAREVIEEPIKPKRPISLVAVPSFYEQDLARIRMIHKDLMNTSINNHARQRLTDVTKEYNMSKYSVLCWNTCSSSALGSHLLIHRFNCTIAYNLSNELFDTCERLQHNLAIAIAKGRQELAKTTSDYASAFNLAKEAWLKEKMEHDLSRTNAVMPSKWGRPSFGTDTIQAHLRNGGNNVIHFSVGQALADIVDGSIMIAKGQASMQPKFRDFVPPPNDPNTILDNGENMTQRQLRVETEYRSQYNAMSGKFQESEAERGRAWRKMMKTRAELDVPHDQSLGGSLPRGRVDLTNYHLIPLPPLRSSSKQTIPRELQPPPAAVASHTSPNTAHSDSKYSAAKIKARRAADGTVAPVSKPKKTKDGLYMRPAGRTRKGMQWDAVNGVWVPEGSQ